MNAVVTGAAGFIGQTLVRRLLRDGWNVVAVDRNELPRTDATQLQADVSVRGSLRDVIDADTVVFHLAAIASVPLSVAEPRDDFQNTMLPVFEVLESARAVRAHVVFPSTASIFDADNALPLDERAVVRPSSPYAAAKVAGEAYCIAYHRAYGLDVRVARLFSVYGPGLRRLAIHDLIRKIEAQPSQLELLGDGQQLRDYLYIDDAIEGLIVVARHGVAGEDYNVASGQPVQLLELARTLCRLMGREDLPIAPTGKSFPGDTARWYADISKVSALGFAPRVDLDEGLRRTIAWLRDTR